MQPGKGFLVWLAGLSVLGFLATDMYLPAFAAIQSDLQTPASAVSASLSLFLAGFAIAQLLWGPLSDRYGRKPILLLGLSIFALGSLGMLWVESATGLLVLRFIQAVGSAQRPSSGRRWSPITILRIKLTAFSRPSCRWLGCPRHWRRY